MGGIGLSLSIEATEPPEGKRRSTPRALHKAITKSVGDWVWRRRAYSLRDTAGQYLAQEESDGYHDGLWTWTETELSWAFMDHAGCCGGSSNTLFHWYLLAFSARRDAIEKLAARRGWRLTGPPPSHPVVVGLSADYPLTAIDSEPVCVPPFALGVVDWEDEWSGPFFDDGGPRPKLSDLSGQALESMKRVALTGRCGCGVCGAVLPSGERTPLPVLEAAWVQIGGDDALKALCKSAASELLEASSWPPTSSAYQDLRGHFDAVTDVDLAGLAFRVAYRVRYA